MRKVISPKLFLALAALILLPTLSHGQAGSFDPTFAGGAPLNIEMDVRPVLEEQVVLSNGTTVMLTWRGVNGRYVNRLSAVTANGEIDTSFGNNGFVDFVWSDVVSSDRASNIAIQNVSGEERIVVSGPWSRANGRKGPIRLLRVDRFFANGELDTSFGSLGTAAFPNAGDAYLDLKVQSDGNILCLGDYGMLARVLADGRSLDPNFGSSGILNLGNRAGWIAVDALDRIYATGTFGSGKGKGAGIYPGVLRYLSTGAVDPTFGTNGRALLPFPTSRAPHIVIDGSGNIVLGSRDNAGGTDDFAAYRLTSKGSVDTSFNGNGRSIFPDFAGFDEIQVGLAVQSDGKVVLTGRATYDLAVEPHRFAVVRFNANGSIDTDFGDSGAVTWSLPQDNILLNVTPRCENADCSVESLIVSGTSSNYLVVAKLLGN